MAAGKVGPSLDNLMKNPFSFGLAALLCPNDSEKIKRPIIVRFAAQNCLQFSLGALQISRSNRLRGILKQGRVRAVS